jgi:hypothetical protein
MTEEKARHYAEVFVRRATCSRAVFSATSATPTMTAVKQH